MNSDIKILKTVEDVRYWREELRRNNKAVAFVPTMGALHEGHLSLMQLAAQKADYVVASIFVNPTQFGPNEDFDRYPRTWEADTEKLKKQSVQAVFSPDVHVLYPQQSRTSINVAEITETLCGPIRPGHFAGVALIVNKLFNIIQPDYAVFGEKDFQQLQVIKTMVRDLNMAIEIVAAPTMRDQHGLALSSRNAYLKENEYSTAIQLNKILLSIAEKFKSGIAVDEILPLARQDILNAGFSSIDYIDVVDSNTLQSVIINNSNPCRVIAAVRLGAVRLIDNMPAN